MWIEAKSYRLYWIKYLVAKDIVNTMDMEVSLWHRRLSHIREKWLNCLARKDVLLGLNKPYLDKYYNCMVGNRLEYPSKYILPQGS